MQRNPGKIFCIDALTYAGNTENLADIPRDGRYIFVKGLIQDAGFVRDMIKNHGLDAVVNFAAETHVDRSLKDSVLFENTNVKGALSLLETSINSGVRRFVQISTDEVYGSLEKGSATESAALNPTSSYAKSKADADVRLQALAKNLGYEGLVITRSSNNYGPYQHPEKFIPISLTNLLQGKRVPVYGSGKNIRDWIYVLDNCDGIESVLENGRNGEIYNIGGGNEYKNTAIVLQILSIIGKQWGKDTVQLVKDRSGHDFRYSIDCSKIKKELGWSPKTMELSDGLRKTVEWYKNNPAWWKMTTESPAFKKYVQQHYVETHGMKE